MSFIDLYIYLVLFALVFLICKQCNEYDMVGAVSHINSGAFVVSFTIRWVSELLYSESSEIILNGAFSSVNVL